MVDESNYDSKDIDGSPVSNIDESTVKVVTISGIHNINNSNLSQAYSPSKRYEGLMAQPPSAIDTTTNF